MMMYIRCIHGHSDTRAPHTTRAYQIQSYEQVLDEFFNGNGHQGMSQKPAQDQQQKQKGLSVLTRTGGEGGVSSSVDVDLGTRPRSFDEHKQV